MLTPTKGRIVLFKLSAEDADSINKRYDDASRNLQSIRENSNGYQAHFGNRVKAGDQCVMIVTAIWSDTCINGKVLLDGNDDLWVTSVNKGEGEHQWDWMPFQKDQLARPGYKETEEAQKQD